MLVSSSVEKLNDQYGILKKHVRRSVKEINELLQFN